MRAGSPPPKPSAEAEVNERDPLEAWLDLEQVSRMVAAPPQWIVERVTAGLVQAERVQPRGETHWRFDSLVVQRLRSMRHTEQCYGAAPELAALVADLEEEVVRLRARLAALRL